MPRPIRRPTKRPGSPRIGAVMLLFYPWGEHLTFVLTRRVATLRAHSGQISFPGGRQDPPESLATTALRETEEEIGIPQQQIKLLGPLTQLYIPPSDFEVHPFVGWLDQRPIFRPNPNEVDAVLETPLEALFNPQIQFVEQRDINGLMMTVPYFHLHNSKVWGATAMILGEMIGRLQALSA
ncbi:MAG TPA: CoA pyrophosphatase [Anaerolineae bacterium]|nr:CoA pyrophosphatase [Anaerolineae bacterium]